MSATSPPSSPAATTLSVSFQRFNITLQYRRRYSAGHTISQAEADLLEQSTLNHIRDNFYNKWQSAFDAGAMPTIEQLQEWFDSYVASYTPQPKMSERVASPVELEARAIATALIKDQLNKQGGSAAKLSKEELGRRVDALLREKPSIMESAARRVAVREELIQSTIL